MQPELCVDRSKHDISPGSSCKLWYSAEISFQRPKRREDSTASYLVALKIIDLLISNILLKPY